MALADSQGSTVVEVLTCDTYIEDSNPGSGTARID
jgi:hypothetical protein